MASSISVSEVMLNLLAAEKKISARIADKVFISTKFFEVASLQTLGLYGPVQSMLEHGGLADFCSLVATSQPQMTREFLTTLQTVDNEDGTLSHITFRF